MIHCDKVCEYPAVTRITMLRTSRALERSTIACICSCTLFPCCAQTLKGPMEVSSESHIVLFQPKHD